MDILNPHFMSNVLKNKIQDLGTNIFTNHFYKSTLDPLKITFVVHLVPGKLYAKKEHVFGSWKTFFKNTRF